MMTDKKTIIAALTLCSNGEMCIEDKWRACPYSPIGETDWYNCAAVMAADALALLKEQESGWISVKDRLPKHYDRVPVLYRFNDSTKLHKDFRWYVHGPFAGADKPHWERFEGCEDEVLYWYELPPEPPKEVDKNA